MVRTAALILLPLVAACNQANDGICSPVMERIQVITPIMGAEVRQNARACVEHWAARLSVGNEPVSVVVGAAMGACHDGLVDGEHDLSETDRRIWRDGLRSIAQFRAVQQRAGNCGIPEVAIAKR